MKVLQPISQQEMIGEFLTLDQPLANAFALRQTLYHQSHNLSREQVLELPVFTPLCKVLLVSPCKVSQAVQSLDQREAGLDVIHPQALFESWLDLGLSEVRLRALRK